MATDGNDHGDPNVSEAKSKLSRLLETEDELEAMLEDARRTAEGLVTAAHAAAEDRVRQFESTLEDENQELASQIARDRDHAIAAIRTEASAESAQLDALGDATIKELANYVVDLLIGGSRSGGAH
jgi:F0F1-type ATP synthase membrane subunit b/b'